MRIAAAVVLAVLFGLQIAAVAASADRPPHVDEVEYLHAGWLMASGEQLYRSFFEHHPPFLFAAFGAIATDDVPAFFSRARWLSGVFGLAAVAAFAAILWRGRPEAAAIAIAFVFASNTLWESALASARAEPFALAFFWTGAALILLRPANPFASGAGAAFVAVAALWNPKWPLGSVVVLAFWVAGTRRRLVSTAIAIALTSIALAGMHAIAPLDRVWFFSVEFTRALWPWLARSPQTLRQFHGGEPFLFAPALLRPLAAAGAGLVLLAAMRRFEERRIPVFFLLLAAASLIELRLTFPWPVIWRYYYAMWGFAVAALIGFAPAAVERLVGRRALAIGVAIVLVIVAGVQIAAVMPFGSSNAWVAQRYFMERLRPGETVLVDLLRHPVAARDAGYYWFGHDHVLPVAGQLRRSARGARLLPPPSYPFCSLDSRLRFVASPRTLDVPAHEQRCFAGLLTEGRLRRTPFSGVYEVVRLE